MSKVIQSVVPDGLQRWVAAEAKRIGLDVSSYVRMILTRTKLRAEARKKQERETENEEG